MAYPKGRAKSRAGRFLMAADRLEAKAKENPPPADAAAMREQATELRRLSEMADGISRASPNETVGDKPLSLAQNARPEPKPLANP